MSTSPEPQQRSNRRRINASRVPPEVVDLAKRIDDELKAAVVTFSSSPTGSIMSGIHDTYSKGTKIVANIEQVTGIANMPMKQIFTPAAVDGENLVPYRQNGVRYNISESFFLALNENRNKKFLCEDTLDVIMGADHFTKMYEAKRYMEALSYYATHFFHTYIRLPEGETALFSSGRDIANLRGPIMDKLEDLKEEAETLLAAKAPQKQEARLHSVAIRQQQRMNDDDESLEELKARAEDLEEELDVVYDKIDEHKKMKSMRGNSNMNRRPLKTNKDVFWV